MYTNQHTYIIYDHICMHMSIHLDLTPTPEANHRFYHSGIVRSCKDLIRHAVRPPLAPLRRSPPMVNLMSSWNHGHSQCICCLGIYINMYICTIYIYKYVSIYINMYIYIYTIYVCIWHIGSMEWHIFFCKTAFV